MVLLLNVFRSKKLKLSLFELRCDLQGVATYFAILDIRSRNRRIQQHGDLFPTVRALEKMLLHAANCFAVLPILW